MSELTFDISNKKSGQICGIQTQTIILLIIRDFPREKVLLTADWVSWVYQMASSSTIGSPVSPVVRLGSGQGSGHGWIWYDTVTSCQGVTGGQQGVGSSARQRSSCVGAGRQDSNPVLVLQQFLFNRKNLFCLGIFYQSVTTIQFPESHHQQYCNNKSLSIVQTC